MNTEHRHVKQKPVTWLPDNTKRLFTLMNASNIELLLVSSRHNIQYMSGGYYYPLYVWDTHTRRTQYISFLVIPHGQLDKTFYVGRPDETEVIEEAELWFPQCYEGTKIESISITKALIEQLKERKLTTKRIGIEYSALPADVCELLKGALPNATFIDAVPLLDGLRAVKNQAEIDIIREGTKRNVEAQEAVLTACRSGISTTEMSELLREEFRARDLHYLYALICAGPHFFRVPSTKRNWTSNNVAHIDAGAFFHNYIIELCRMAYMGTPSKEAEILFQACHDLKQIALTTLKPNIEIGSIQRTAEDFIRSHPLGEYGKFIAHGIGLIHHEDPVVHRESTAQLEVGMVISIEMEFRTRDIGHVKIEDMVVITETGPEVINSTDAWFTSNS